MDELKRTVPVLVGTILLFFAHQALHIEPATVAHDRRDGDAVPQPAEARGLARGHRVADAVLLHRPVRDGRRAGGDRRDRRGRRGIAYVTAGDRTAELLGIAWASAFGSGIVDNIPFTAAMIPVVESLQSDAGDDAYWWALALGACFGGNATIVAAAANVAAAGMAARAGRPIGFVTFLRIGVPVTIVSMVLATAYIALRYL